MCMLLLFATAASAAPPDGKGKKPVKDSSPPLVAIGAPTDGSTVTGAFVVSGSASDPGGIARIEVSTDGGPFSPAVGTTQWAYQGPTDALGTGSHTFTARAFDGTGNSAETTVTITVGSPAPLPPPPPTDMTPPSVWISQPKSGATVEGIVTAAGTAADAGGLATVDVSLDGGPFRAATGTASWTVSMDTTSLKPGTHTLTARASDVAGNRSTVSATVTIATSTAGGSRLVTPEGATIEVAADVEGWTAQEVYEILRPNAYQLSLIGPALTVMVQTAYASQTASSASESNGVYSNFRSIIYLRANGASNFDFRPDQIIAHEYGHAWTSYHLYVTQRNDWTKYLQARGLLGDSRLDSTYNWSRGEMIADDYRLLFGTPTAQQQAGYINSAVVDPRTVSGLRDWFINTWAKP
jgi:hypothetical protein